MYEIIELPKRTDIYLTKGDTFVAEVEAYLQNTRRRYTPVEGDTVRFALKKCPDDAECLIYKTIPIDTMILRIESNDTKDLPRVPYWYDIQLTYQNGDVDTFISGYLTLTAEVD